MPRHKRSPGKQYQDRCCICQQKGIFLCEHDTPYRDIYTGAYDPSAPLNYTIRPEGMKSRTAMHSHPPDKYHGHPPPFKNVHVTEHHHDTHKFPTTSYRHDKKSKSSSKSSRSCTIL